MTRNPSPLLVASVLLAASALRADGPAPKPVSGGITWVFDYQEGRKLARASGKPLLVVFRCEQ